MGDKKHFGTKASWAAAFTVASVWFGTHVGGGFASGNQVIQYFSQYGATAVIFPIITFGFLGYVTWVYMTFAKLKGFDNYKDTFKAFYPQEWMEILFEIFYIIILLAAVAAAVTGAGNVLANFLGIEYVGGSKIMMNLIIIAVLIILCIFGVKLVIAASTFMSIAIIIVTTIMVITGLSADLPAITNQLAQANGITETAAYTKNIGAAIWKGCIIYGSFQAVSIAPMIAASHEDLTLKGTTRSAILGWLMNGIAAAACGYMLYLWYPLLKVLQDAGVDGFTTALNIPNQTMLGLIGNKFVLALFSVLLFFAFVSTCVTLVFSMIQRFGPLFFPQKIKSEKARGFCVAVIVIAICFALSLLGLTNIIKYAYGYMGYYSLVVIMIPALIWGSKRIKEAKEEAIANGYDVDE